MPDILMFPEDRIIKIHPHNSIPSEAKNETIDVIVETVADDVRNQLTHIHAINDATETFEHDFDEFKRALRSLVYNALNVSP